MIRIEDLLKKYSKFVVWGTGKRFRDGYKKNINISYLVDSDSSKWGEVLMGLPIESPQKLLEETTQTAILIVSVYDDTIIKSIIKMGIKCDFYTEKMLFPNPFGSIGTYDEKLYVPDSPNAVYSIERNVLVLIALLKLNGIRKIVISPGSTNICFVASVQRDSYFELYSCIDERAAAYVACGLAEESNEAVALSCTGATASRNYFAGLTEAYYRQIPILAITSSQFSGRIGMGFPQVTDRQCLMKDVVKISVELPCIYTEEDLWNCEIRANQALLELKHHGKGPCHINLITNYEPHLSIKSIPTVKFIERLYVKDEFPNLKKEDRIGIYVGAHAKWSQDLVSVVEEFCIQYNAVILCDQTSNYRGRYGVLAALVTNQIQKCDINERFDILIHIGNISGAYMNVRAKQVWRVNPDGMIRDPLYGLRYLFEMSEEDFFTKYVSANDGTKMNYEDTYASLWREGYHKLIHKIPELPFSNIWVAKTTAAKIPDNSVIYLGILNSLRSWNFFEVSETVTCYANTGGFGIEGGLSSMIGASLASPNKLFLGCVGDLAFIDEMNIIGNRHVGRNVRILLVNNGAGAEFHGGTIDTKMLGEDVDEYTAAGGHFLSEKRTIAHFVSDFGFEYICIKSKDDYKRVLRHLFDLESDKPILVEVLVSMESEVTSRKIIESLQ